MSVNETIFTKNKFDWQVSAKNIDVKFHEDPEDGVITDNRKQKDGEGRPYFHTRPSFLLREESPLL